ncbi:hypothetical protein PG999_005531 [Apiospora kogelbergensis]|uniref:Uncharacterized protein n=1 Tax=Apiospora kogelbergensis TaxID=1337665 RepID=A0AAW0R2G8_9PEZI
MRGFRIWAIKEVENADGNLHSMHAMVQVHKTRKLVDGGRPGAELLELQVPRRQLPLALCIDAHLDGADGDKGLVKGEDVGGSDVSYDGGCIGVPHAARIAASSTEGKHICYGTTCLKNHDEQLGWAGAGQEMRRHGWFRNGKKMLTMFLWVQNEVPSLSWVVEMWRRYLSNGELEHFAAYDNLPYVDGLFDAIGVAARRKKGWLGNMFAPIMPADVGRVWQEYLKRQRSPSGS